MNEFLVKSNLISKTRRYRPSLAFVRGTALPELT